MAWRPSRSKGAARCLWAGGVLIGTVVGCTPPIRQYDLRNQTLTCEQANEYSLRTLQAMGFTITAFEPAAVGRPGALRGSREERGTQNVTVVVTCTGAAATIDASEDGKLFGQLEFRRGFYLSFTAVASQVAVIAAAAREEAQRPLQEKREKGLHVLLEPVQGLAAKLDFDLDLAAASVLPLQVTINNATSRTYNFDPADIALIQKDGTRVHPMPVEAAAQRVADAQRQKEAAPDSAPLDRGEVTQRLRGRLLISHSVSANQTVKGYLFFPLAPYVKGRVSLEDQESEETEGFVVEF